MNMQRDENFFDSHKIEELPINEKKYYYYSSISTNNDGNYNQIFTSEKFSIISFIEFMCLV